MKEAADKEEIELLYFDESGFSTQPNVQRSWSPLGQAHEADASAARKRVNVLGALNAAHQRLHFEIIEHNTTRDDVVNFLDHRAKTSDPNKWTFVVLDNARIHHAIDLAIRQEWLIRHRFSLLYLPPYSPELNLIEILWKQAKYHWREFKTWSKDSLITEVHDLLSGFGTKFHICYA